METTEPKGGRSRPPGWDVDRAQDPQAYVRFLDRAGARPHIQELREQSYALLEARPGLRLLDAGCGVGDDARALARLVSPGGSVVGLDGSAVMVSEAIHRSAGLELPVEFVQGDIRALPFADESFDGCRSERVLQHVADPEMALVELIRVARPGAMIVVVDSDHGMMALNGSNRKLTMTVLACWVAAITNGWIGRQLPGMFTRHGLRDLTIAPSASVYTTLEPHRAALLRCAKGAARRGVITEVEADTFIADQDALDARGEFLLSGVLFTVAGRKP
jgi:ubiquinone/menaquinone biosynthesis C-methylase UbiE